MFQSRLKTILVLLATLLTLIIMIPVFAFLSFSESLDEKLEAKKILKTTEFLVPQLMFRTGELWTASEVSELLDKNGYRRRSGNQVLLEMDYTLEEKVYSEEQAGNSSKDHIQGSYTEIKMLTKNKNQSPIIFELHDNKIQKITLNAQEKRFVSLGENSIAQFSDNKQLWQKNVTLSKIPAQCLQAVIAIEDSQFLDHSGVNYTSILRAAIKNLMAGRTAQGGSTITQQLIKNYILSPERTYTRKFKEFFYALNIEKKYSKDEILETYLNIIYLGQSGALQIHGYGAASEYYFGKNIENLKLHECALLAAIINNPGRYNPWRNPENAQKRRELVLNKMLEINAIHLEEKKLAEAQTLPKSGREFPSETAPYYVQAALSELNTLKIPIEGNKVLLALDPRKQQAAQDAVDLHLNNLKKRFEKEKIKNLNVEKLEAVVLVLDLATGQIMVATGGKNYRASQFNRITEAKRQVGSLAKPFVYYTGLEQKTLTVDSILSNEKQTFTVGRQKWSPDNYNKKNGGKVPLLIALTQSLNIPVAHLIMSMGADSVHQTLNLFSLGQDTPKVPSIALGAFEKTPLEMLHAYATLARFGTSKDSHFVLEVQDVNGKPIYTHSETESLVTSPVTAAELVSLMKWTPLIGTAQGISSQFPWPSAGKTGTTNNYKDAWYVGFTSSTLGLVWLGYDEPQSTYQTGGGLAVPIWKSVMEKVLAHQAIADFNWPESVEPFNLTIEENSYEVRRRKSN